MKKNEGSKRNDLKQIYMTPTTDNEKPSHEKRISLHFLERKLLFRNSGEEEKMGGIQLSDYL